VTERRPRIGFLGPFGTFTEQALLTQADLSSAELVPYRSVPEVLDAVEAGEVDRGFVPIENSIEGTVNFTQDALVFDHDLLIQREVVLDIEHCLLAPSGVGLADVTAVHSIPVATAQCAGWLRSTLPSVEVHLASSTADAAHTVAERMRAGERSIAAIASENAARLYGLEVLARDIADHPGDQTRFVLVGKGEIPAPTGHDRTGIVVFQRADEPGSLLSILQEFAARRINLSLLVSRPTKAGGLGDYCFIMYADGHIADELVADALRDLHTKQGGVKFLGSYPAAGTPTHTVREHADDRWRRADDWITELRERVSRG
jgi:prephenate dehydratase